MKFTDGIMLDMNANGGIDTSVGKNNALRRYREALDRIRAYPQANGTGRDTTGPGTPAIIARERDRGFTEIEQILRSGAR
jgi:hypothetical protein